MYNQVIGLFQLLGGGNNKAELIDTKMSDKLVALLVSEKYDTYPNIMQYEISNFFATLEIYVVSKINEKRIMEAR